MYLFCKTPHSNQATLTRVTGSSRTSFPGKPFCVSSHMRLRHRLKYLSSRSADQLRTKTPIICRQLSDHLRTLFDRVDPRFPATVGNFRGSRMSQSRCGQNRDELRAKLVVSFTTFWLGRAKDREYRLGHGTRHSVGDLLRTNRRSLTDEPPITCGQIQSLAS